MERKPITCRECNSPFYVTHILGGLVAVRPGEWFLPTSSHWDAQCECRHLRRPTEWELYRAMGCNVAVPQSS